MSFTKEQPKDGDTILHCGHLDHDQDRWRWFKFEKVIVFKRPDGIRGEAEWFAACEACFIKHGEKVADFVRGDGRWTGDEPAIEEPEQS